MDNFWNAIDNLRVQLIREERVEHFKVLQKKEVSESTAAGTHPSLASGPCTKKVAEGEDATPNSKSREDVIGLIESVLLEILQDVGNGCAPSLSYRNRNTWDNVRFEEWKGLELSSDSKLTNLRFDSLSTIKRFALTVKLLASIHRNLQANTYCTKRDLYYQDPQAFGSQSCLDALVDNISCMLHVPRACLHVFATSKGLICGDLKYTDIDGNRIDCNGSSTMVPSHVEAIENIESGAHFVLVVEKDATYQRLVDEDVATKLGPCIIATAKGFPDVNTRLLVRRFWETLHIPVLVLVDADPHGIEILMVYKFGSRALSMDASNLTVPVIQWLGVWPSDITRLNVPPESVMPLTNGDICKANELLKRPYINSVPMWKSELETMLANGTKAEIQCLDSISPNMLFDVYLPNKLRFGGWM